MILGARLAPRNRRSHLQGREQLPSAVPKARFPPSRGRPRPLGEALTVLLLYVHLGLTKNSVR